MSKIRDEDIGDGSRKVGNGPGYLIFTSAGDVQVLREGFDHLTEKKTALKHFNAFEVDGTLQAGIWTLVNLNSEAAFDRLKAILETKEDYKAEGLIDQLCHDLKATRKILRSDGKSIAPHDTFRGLLRQLAKKLGYPPTKADVRKAMNEITGYEGFTAAHCSKLCDANGFSWLPIKPRWKKTVSATIL
jgi:hypothetical protein